MPTSRCSSAHAVAGEGGGVGPLRRLDDVPQGAAAGAAAYAVDLAKPALLCRRPVSAADGIAGVGGGRLFTAGEDVGAIDLASGTMKWSTKLSLTGTNARPLVTADRLFCFAGRGVCEIDPADGDTVRILRGVDRESIGGTIFHAGGRLICVSNCAVTARAPGGSAAASTRWAPTGQRGRHGQDRHDARSDES